MALVFRMFMVIVGLVMYFHGLLVIPYHFFFFSSRRRHTRSKRDWSSDVCSSDLADRRGLGQCPDGGLRRGSGTQSLVSAKGPASDPYTPMLGSREATRRG